MPAEVKHRPSLNEAIRLAFGDVSPPDDFVQLAHNSSRRYEADRWTELELHRSPATDQFMVVVIGRSVVPGEVDRYRVEVSEQAEVIVEAVAPKDDNGRPRLTWVAKKTLLEAAAEDEDIAFALDAFEEFHRD